jgi:large subunit ribosomal protein L21
MYAVVKTGGKQYRVAKDDVIIVEKLSGETGSSIELEEILAIDDGKELTIGTPLVEGARVAATVLDQKRDKKIIIFKKKRRTGYKRSNGHRQDITVLRITDILTKGQSGKAAAPAKAAPAKDEPAAEAAPVKKTAAKKTATKKAVAKKTPAKKAAAKKSTAKKSTAKKAAAGKTEEKD